MVSGAAILRGLLKELQNPLILAGFWPMVSLYKRRDEVSRKRAMSNAFLTVS